MLTESIYFLFKMNIKNVAVIVALCLAIVFLVMDKCGSSRKVDELKGQYKEASRIAEVERRTKEETIKEQAEKIEVLNLTIKEKGATITRKDRDLAKIEDELGVIKRNFESLEACQSQYNKLVEAFTLAKGIGVDKDSVIFSLNEKYDAQVIISLEYKSMYESVQGLVDIRTRQVKELEKINRRLRFTSKLKTGIVITMAAVVAYSLLKD